MAATVDDVSNGFEEGTARVFELYRARWIVVSYEMSY